MGPSLQRFGGFGSVQLLARWIMKNHCLSGGDVWWTTWRKCDVSLRGSWEGWTSRQGGLRRTWKLEVPSIPIYRTLIVRLHFFNADFSSLTQFPSCFAQSRLRLPRLRQRT